MAQLAQCEVSNQVRPNMQQLAFDFVWQTVTNNMISGLEIAFGSSVYYEKYPYKSRNNKIYQNTKTIVPKDKI